MLDWLAKIAQEWPVIGAAPWSFASAVFVMACIIVPVVWFAINWSYRSVISSRDGEINLLERQRDDYKDKLGGASPDEARARIDRLETQVKALAPRRLADDQKTRLATLLKRLPGTIRITSDMSVADASWLAGDLIVAFNSAGWQTQNSAILGPGNPPPHGIALRIPDPGSLTPRQALIVEALDAAGVEFDIQRGDPDFLLPPSPGAPFPQSPLDAAILISQKSL